MATAKLSDVKLVLDAPHQFRSRRKPTCATSAGSAKNSAGGPRLPLGHTLSLRADSSMRSSSPSGRSDSSHDRRLRPEVQREGIV